MDDDPKQIAMQRFGPMVGPWTSLDVITQHATDPPLVVESLLDALRPAAQPGATICELGFGPGWLLDAMRGAFPDCRIAGLDLSPGMARAAYAAGERRTAIMLGDMERLPFREASLDAIVTCWTLYFMSDIDAAIEGTRRCLKPGGTFVAATVAADNMLEYEELGIEAARAIGRTPLPDIGKRFDLDNGAAYLGRHFDDVETRDWRGEMVIRDLEPLLQLWTPYGPELPADEKGRAFEVFRDLAAARLQRDGELRITRHSGSFIAHA